MQSQRIPSPRPLVELGPGNFRGAIAFYAYTAQSAAARRRAAAQLPDLTPRLIPGTPRQA